MHLVPTRLVQLPKERTQGTLHFVDDKNMRQARRDISTLRLPGALRWNRKIARRLILVGNNPTEVFSPYAFTKLNEHRKQSKRYTSTPCTEVYNDAELIIRIGWSRPLPFFFYKIYLTRARIVSCLVERSN